MAEEKLSKDDKIEAICEVLKNADTLICNTIKNLNDMVFEALTMYIFSDNYEIKFTKKEIKNIIEKCEYLNSLDIEDSVENRSNFLHHLLGDVSVQQNGSLVIHNMELVGLGIKKEKAEQLLSDADLETLTPFALKEWLKERKWTYKDLAEAIGAVESTVRNWMTKESLPEWAKRSILYIQKCEALQEKFDNSSVEALSIKERLQDFKQLINEL